MIALVRAANVVAPPIATDLVGEEAGGQKRKGRSCSLRVRPRSIRYRCGCSTAAAAAAAVVGILPPTNHSWNPALRHVIGLHIGIQRRQGGSLPSLSLKGEQERTTLTPVPVAAAAAADTAADASFGPKFVDGKLRVNFAEGDEVGGR